MSTTLVPATGNAPLFTQGGVGTAPGYSAIDIRRAANLSLQEGVYGASDFMVVQRAAGANLSVDIGMPAGGFACVQGDSVSGQGLYVVPVHSSTVNEAIAPANPTIPRVDQVILEVFDNVLDGTGNNLARVRVLTGTASAGATLNNRTGAATLPGSALLLADVLVGAGAVSVTNAVIRDRRKWARGALWASASTPDYTITSAFADIDSVNLGPRIECGGSPLRVTFSCTGFYTPSANGLGPLFRFTQDGSLLLPPGVAKADVVNVTNSDYEFTVSAVVTPAAGSHVFAIQAQLGNVADTGVIQSDGANDRMAFVVEEIARQNTANNTTTTG